MVRPKVSWTRGRRGFLLLGPLFGWVFLPVFLQFFWASSLAFARGDAPSSANELIREARAHEAAGEEQTALRLYTEALNLDPTSGDGYLGLASLRLRLGDPREAERVYSVSLEHVPELNAAFLGRARARRAIGRAPEAAEDLETYAAKERDPGALRELAAWYGEDHRPLAQLAVWRRLLALSTSAPSTSSGPGPSGPGPSGPGPSGPGPSGPDPALAREARTMIRALQIVVHPLDPVTTGETKRAHDVRATIAHIARRGG